MSLKRVGTLSNQNWKRVEKNSLYPLGEAIVKRATERGIAPKDSEGFDTFGGKRVVAKVEGQEVLIGNRTLLQERNITYPPEHEEHILQLEHEAKTVILVAFGGQLQGIIAIADALKETTQQAIEAFKKEHLEVVMITGDNKHTAEAIARKVGIDQVLAEVLPQDKANEVKRLQDQGKRVAFVGDGINDAPAPGAVRLRTCYRERYRCGD